MYLISFFTKNQCITIFNTCIYIVSVATVLSTVIYNCLYQGLIVSDQNHIKLKTVTNLNMKSLWHVTKDLLILLAFHLLRSIWNSCLKIKWLADGTAKHISQSSTDEHYQKSTQMLDVIAKYHLDPVCIPNSTKHFLLYEFYLN